MFREDTDFPPITLRIKNIVDEKFHGNVRQFALNMGMSDSVKINRLFKIDKRNNEYPMPSTDIIIQICNAFNISADWLLFGKETNKTVNNINIDANNLEGDNNIMGDSNTQNSDLLEVVKSQQEQISKLLIMVTNGR